MAMNLDHMCRLCMQERTVLLPLFGGNGDLPAKIEFLTCVQMDTVDGLPITICQDCVKMVDNFMDFKNKVEQSDKTLRELVKKHEENEQNMQVFIKEEDAADEGNFVTHIVAESLNEDPTVEAEDPLLFIKQESTPATARTIPDKDERTEKKQDDVTVSATPAFIERPRYECDSCPRKFFTFKGFKYHRGKHIQKHGYECMICSRKFQSWQRFRVHRQKHTHGLGLECPKCFKRFDSDKALRFHCARFHFDKPVLQCNVCKKTFISQKNLILHTKTHSLEERRHKCLVCNEEFSTGFGLRLHSRIHSIDSTTGKTYNPPEPRHQCAYCKKKFFELKGLITHRRYCKVQPLLKLPMTLTSTSSTSLKGMHECPFCQKVFDEFRSLSFHVRVHKRIDHRCSICHKRFKTKAGVGRHEKTHNSFETHEVNPTVDLSGSEISYMQATADVSHHANSPLDENESNQIEGVINSQFECSICKQNFESAKTLNIHTMQIHRKNYSEEDFTSNQSHQDSIESLHERPVSRIESSLIENQTLFINDSASTKSAEYTSQLLSRTRQDSNDSDKNISSEEIVCSYCDRTFKNIKAISTHSIRTHNIHYNLTRQDSNDSDKNISSREIIVCSYCDRTFKNTKALSTHSIRTHNIHYKVVLSYRISSSSNVRDQEPGYELATGTECSICGQTFKSTKGLRSHISKTHKWNFNEMDSTSRSEVLDENYGSQNENVLANSNLSLSAGNISSEVYAPLPECSSEEQRINNTTNNALDESSCKICNKDFQNPRGLRSHNSKAHRWMYNKEEAYSELISNSDDDSHRNTNIASADPSVDDAENLPEGNDVSGQDSNAEAENTEEPKCCNICKRYFKNRRALTTHVVKNHRLEIKYMGISSHSELVNVPFEISENNMQGDHGTLPTNDEPMMPAKNASNLLEHTDPVVQETNSAVENTSISDTDCHMCNRKFKSPKALRGHNSKVHKWMFKGTECVEDNSEIQCDLCPQRFRNIRGLRTHVSKQHREEKDQTDEPAETLSDDLTPENTEETGYSLRRHGWHNYNDDSSHSSSSDSDSDHAKIDKSRSFETADFQTNHYCEECNKSFSNRKSLLVHKALVHDCLDSMEEIETLGLVDDLDSDTEHRCEYCNKTFRSRKSLHTHNFEIHGNRSGHNDYNKGIRTSAPSRSKNSQVGYHCLECNKSFKKEKGLLVHNGMIHNLHTNVEDPERDEYTCDADEIIDESHDCYICDKAFSTEAELGRHLSRVHKQLQNEATRNQHICYVCEENFSTGAELRKHHNRVHNHPQNEATASHNQQSLPNNYLCQVCNFTTNSLRNFRFHCSRMDHLTPENLVQQPADSQEYLYECSLCYKTFFSQFSYTRHLKRCKENAGVSKKAANIPAIEKPCIDSGVEVIELFSCDKCSYNSRTLEGLQIHCMKLHSDTNEENPEVMDPHTSTGSRFTCCNKSFSTQKGLNIHLSAMHRNDNLHKSRGDSFVANSEESEQLYGCTDCDNTFNNEQSLMTHYNKKHRDKNTNRGSDDSSSKSKTNALSITSVNNVDVEVYVCCDKTFISKQKFNLHRSKVHKEDDNVMENRSENQASGRKSVTNESNAKVNYNCLICNRTFSSERGLNIHVTMVHGEVKSSKTEKSNTSTKNDSSHKETTIEGSGVSVPHTEEQNYEEKEVLEGTADTEEISSFSCSICNKRFINKSTLNVHTTEMHAEEVIVIEDDDNNDNLNHSSHSSTTLAVENDEAHIFSCSSCKQTFDTEDTLNEHYAKMHNDDSAGKVMDGLESADAEEMDCSTHDKAFVNEQMNSDHCAKHPSECSSAREENVKSSSSENGPNIKVDCLQSEKCVFSEEGGEFKKRKIQHETDDSESLPKVTNVHSLQDENSENKRMSSADAEEIDCSLRDKTFINELFDSDHCPKHPSECSSAREENVKFSNSESGPNIKVDSLQSEKCVFGEKGEFQKRKIHHETDNSESLPKVTNVHSLQDEKSFFSQIAPEFKQEIHHETVNSGSPPMDPYAPQCEKRVSDVKLEKRTVHHHETGEEENESEKRTKIEVNPESENNTSHVCLICNSVFLTASSLNSHNEECHK